MVFSVPKHKHYTGDTFQEQERYIEETTGSTRNEELTIHGSSMVVTRVRIRIHALGSMEGENAKCVRKTNCELLGSIPLHNCLNVQPRSVS
jgi:hypothetical protein